MISQREYVERMARLQALVAWEGLDAFLITNEENIYYLTGVSYKQQERPFFIVVRPEPPVVLLVPALEADHLGQAPNVDQLITYWEYPSPPGQGWAERLAEILDSVDRLGVEPSLTLELEAGLDGRDKKVVALVEQLRLVKSPAELELIGQAARFCDLGAKLVVDASYHGVSEVEVVASSRKLQLAIMRQAGYDPLTTSITLGVWNAPLSAQPHGVPAIDDRLTDGPLIILSYLRVNGYAAETERTYFLSEPTAEVKEAFAAMTEARWRAVRAVRPGAPCAEVDLAANDFLRDEGFGPYLLHRTGHGIGLGNHEGPWVASGSQHVLARDMVISIEPGIYLPGVGGVRHSDTVLVTADGCRFLTSYPMDLPSLVVRGRKPLKRLMGRLIRRMAGIG